MSHVFVELSFKAHRRLTAERAAERRAVVGHVGHLVGDGPAGSRLLKAIPQNPSTGTNTVYSPK